MLPCLLIPRKLHSPNSHRRLYVDKLMSIGNINPWILTVSPLKQFLTKTFIKKLTRNSPLFICWSTLGKLMIVYSPNSRWRLYVDQLTPIGNINPWSLTNHVSFYIFPTDSTWKLYRVFCCACFTLHFITLLFPMLILSPFCSMRLSIALSFQVR